MPIPVICPGCKTRFNVSDKFAGKQGPCPKCKTVITIPEKVEEVVVHAPQEYGPKNAAGVGVLKPISRKETQISLVAVVGIISGIVVTLIAAWIVRGLDEHPAWLLALGVFIVAPPVALGGYTFLRDDELEPHRGLSLMWRVLACSVVYALLWGAYAWGPALAFGLEQLELFHLLFIVPPVILAGGAAASLALELDFGSGVVHYALYLLVTIILGFIVGADFLGTPPPPAA